MLLLGGKGLFMVSFYRYFTVVIQQINIHFCKNFMTFIQNLKSTNMKKIHSLKFLFFIAALLLIGFACEKPTEDLTGGGGGTGGTGGGGGGGGSTVPTVTAPDTYFIDEYRTFSALGGSWYQQFTVSTTTSFVLRGASTFACDFAVFSTTQLNNFNNNQPFTAYVVMDNQYGTAYVTLAPGTYYAGVRNQVSGSNSARIELDKTVTLPASDRAIFIDNYFSAARSIPKNGGKLWQPFTVQQGYRYFTDGCNSGNIESWIVTETEMNKFINGQAFQYYVDYHSTSSADPGSHEVKLPPGNYAYIFQNSSTANNESITYVCERWRVN